MNPGDGFLWEEKQMTGMRRRSERAEEEGNQNTLYTCIKLPRN